MINPTLDLTPTRILDEDVVVRLWMAEIQPGKHGLAYLMDEGQGMDTILVIPAEPTIADDLESCLTSLLDVFKGEMWMVTRHYDDTLMSQIVRREDIPNHRLPRPGVYLRLLNSEVQV